MLSVEELGMAPDVLQKKKMCEKKVRKSLTKGSNGSGSDGHTFIFPVLVSSMDPLLRPAACRNGQESSSVHSHQ